MSENTKKALDELKQEEIKLKTFLEKVLEEDRELLRRLAQ